MNRIRIALLCLPLALAGAGLAAHATTRVRARELELVALAEETRAQGRSFVETLQGEHAELQQRAFERRRAAALSLAAARRDRLVGVLLGAASVLGAAALSVMSRISREIEEDRRHVGRAAP